MRLGTLWWASRLLHPLLPSTSTSYPCLLPPIPAFSLPSLPSPSHPSHPCLSPPIPSPPSPSRTAPGTVRRTARERTVSCQARTRYHRQPRRHAARRRVLRPLPTLASTTATPTPLRPRNHIRLGSGISCNGPPVRHQRLRPKSHADSLSYSPSAGFHHPPLHPPLRSPPPRSPLHST